MQEREILEKLEETVKTYLKLRDKTSLPQDTQFWNQEKNEFEIHCKDKEELKKVEDFIRDKKIITLNNSRDKENFDVNEAKLFISIKNITAKKFCIKLTKLSEKNLKKQSLSNDERKEKNDTEYPMSQTTVAIVPFKKNNQMITAGINQEKNDFQELFQRNKEALKQAEEKISAMDVEITEIKTSLETKEESLIKIKEENSLLADKVSLSSKELMEKQELLKKAAEEKSIYKRNFTFLLQTLMDKKQEIENLNVQLDEKKSYLARLEEENSIICSNNQVLTGMILTQRQEIECLNNELNEKRMSLAKMQEENIILFQNLDASQRMLTGRCEEIDQIRLELAGKEKSLQEANNNLNELKNVLRENNFSSFEQIYRIVELEQELSQKSTRLEALDQELNQKKIQLEKLEDRDLLSVNSINFLKNKLKELEKNLTEKSKKNDHLNQKMRNQGNEIASLKRELNDLKNQQKSLPSSGVSLGAKNSSVRYSGFLSGQGGVKKITQKSQPSIPNSTSINLT